MEKIKICDKEYNINCNAFTRTLYKKKFGRGIFEEIGIVQDFNIEIENIKKQENKSQQEIDNEVNSYTLKKVDDILDVIQKIAYIEILTADMKFMSYEDWLMSLETINLADDWTGKVMELASDCFRG